MAIAAATRSNYIVYEGSIRNNGLGSCIRKYGKLN